jgi:AcrR family transcriptional regulator
VTVPKRAVGRPPRYLLEDLVERVIEEFLVRGYDATSMEDLAAATGLTKSALYHHVAGKEEFLRYAVTHALGELFSVLGEPEAREGRAVERLEHVVHRSVEVLVANLPSVTLLLRVRGNTETERWAITRRREFDRKLTELVRQAVDEGDLRDDLDPALVTRLLFGMVNSVVEWYRPGHGSGVPDALVALAFDGLRRAG